MGNAPRTGIEPDDIDAAGGSWSAVLQGDCISRRGVPAEVSEVRREPREAGGRGTIDAFLAAAARFMTGKPVLLQRSLRVFFLRGRPRFVIYRNSGL